MERSLFRSLALAAWVLSACAHDVTERRSTASLAARAGSSAACVRLDLSPDSPYRLPLAGPVEDPELLGYLQTVPAEVRRIVLAAGLEPLLARTLREQARGAGGLTLAQLDHRQEMSSLRGSLDSQLSALLFEIDCTGDRLEDLVHQFEQEEHARELKLTIASLVTGAVGGMASGIWDAKDREGDGPPILAAVGAGATAALGVAAFLPHHQTVHFSHERNLLAPVVSGSDPQHIYPTFAFRLLTLPTSDGTPTPAQELTQRWRALIAQKLPAEQRPRAEALLFGNGGVYSDALVELREHLFDQLESRVGALHRELEILERYLTRVTARDAVAQRSDSPPSSVSTVPVTQGASSK